MKSIDRTTVHANGGIIYMYISHIGSIQQYNQYTTTQLFIKWQILSPSDISKHATWSHNY